MSDESILSTIHALDLLVQGAIDAALSGIGITAAHWRVIDAALITPGASSADLARACGVTPQSMHQLVVHLEQRGLLVRTPHPVNERIQQIYVSNAGELRHEDASAVLADLEARIFTAFSDDERAAFGRLLGLALGSLRRS